MTATAYRFRRADMDHDWSGLLAWREVADRIERAAVFALDYRLREVRPNPTEFGRRRGPFASRRRLRNRINAAPLGTVIQMRSSKTKDGRRQDFRVIRVRAPLPEAEPHWAPYDYTDVSPDLQRLCRVAVAFNPATRTNGLAYTRKIAGSYLWSQHSRWKALACKGNASDLTWPRPWPTGNSIPDQRAMVDFLVGHGFELNLGMAISERTYWRQEDDYEPHYYSGVAHVSHGHFQGPTQSGWVCW